MLQLEQRIVDQRIDLGMLQDLKKTDATHTLAEEAAEHAVLCPNVAILSRDVLNDVVSGRAENVLCAVGLLFRDAGSADIALEKFDRCCDLLHQACERGAQQ